MRRVWLTYVFIFLTVAGVAHAAQASFDGMVDIGGRSLRIACQGTGTPTVIVETGMSASATNNPSWQAIARRIAPTTQVCLYDRAGRGGSDPAPAGLRSSDDVVSDLYHALAKVAIAPPYLLVGHSIGGIYVLDFARLHANAVAGIVLVDSSHPDQITAWRRVFPRSAPGEPEATAHAREVLMNMDRAANPESIDIGESYTEARKIRSLGSKPLIVLTHSPKWKMVPNLPESVLVKLEAETQRLQRRFLRLSTRSEQRVAVSAGHELPSEDPDLVASGILDAIKMSRAR